MELRSLREQVCAANLSLPRPGLVTWTSGNVSARDPETDLVVIKPSGPPYEGMTPGDMVVVSLDGQVVHGNRTPSSDTASHLTVYRARPEVMAVVRTHSTYATAFAASGQPIPCCLTAIADEFDGLVFDGLVSCGGYASSGGEETGREIVAGIGSSPAILMRQHGVFTIGTSIAQAVESAVRVEDVARTVALDRQSRGAITPLPDSPVRADHDRHRRHCGAALAGRGVTR
jgi:L-ribulose-5-phosphate 4-epimerase